MEVRADRVVDLRPAHEGWFVFFSGPFYEQRNQIIGWLWANIEGKFSGRILGVWFENEDEARLCFLRWA
jgi:hypothetical protein